MWSAYQYDSILNVALAAPDSYVMPLCVSTVSVNGKHYLHVLSVWMDLTKQDICRSILSSNISDLPVMAGIREHEFSFLLIGQLS